MSSFSDMAGRAGGGGISGIPTGIQALAGFGGAGLAMGMAYFFTQKAIVVAIVGAGILIVVGLVLIYKMFLGWMRKRRANPMGSSLSGNAAATPQGISEPARRARLDDLRRIFDQGIEKFRAAGKNLYAVPWYVLVGEPGSGKTEAIRHCNVGFPPGLQDPLQGTGGTLNMNWWFTQTAIILDTAGRLMFEEVPAGSTNEWAEFLKLLKGNRPNCPLNGMLLVIPVDTLIKDTAEQIEKKSSKIAQQFDQIQRTLGVRFPVFVIITKCDLLNGFREFFDDLNSPQLQYQIMGWSDPRPAGERFDPAAVMTHLENVKQRLIARRQHLLLDPVHTEDPQGRRADQVDALYELPESLAKIGPRLRAYLETIFVAGEWSPQPLFLRGIYFTSSMTEGSALDTELAKVLNVPLDSLPEGRVFRRDRAYFLKDLFIEKVFREKGLVTRASNIDKQQRRRRATVLTVGFLSVLLLFGLTWLGWRQLDKSIGKPRDFWVAAQGFDPSLMQVIEKGNNKYSDSEISIGSSKTNIAGFFGSNLPMIQQPIEIPLLFRPMAIIKGAITDKQKAAYQALFESTVLAPMFNASRDQVKARDWSPDTAAALAQLMKVEYVKATGELPKAAGGDTATHPQVDPDPLFKVALSDADFTKYANGDSAKIQSVIDWLYKGAGATSWPPAASGAGSREALDAIKAGIDQTASHWQQQRNAGSKTISAVTDAQKALEDFQTAQADLLRLHNSTVNSINDYQGYRDNWGQKFKAVIDARDRAMQMLQAAGAKSGEEFSLRAIYDKALNSITSDAQKSYDALLVYTPPESAAVDPAKANDSYKGLADARAKIIAAQKDLQSWANSDDAKKKVADLSALDAACLALLKGPDGAPHRRFEVFAMLYDAADKKLVDTTRPLPAAGGAGNAAASNLDDALTAADKEYAAVVDALQPLKFLASSDTDLLAQALNLSTFTLNTSARAKKNLITSAAIDGLPATADKWPDAIAARAKSFPPDSLVRQPVPMIKFDAPNFSPRYSPDAAGEAAVTIDTIRKLTGGDASSRVLDAAVLSRRLEAVQKEFNSYRDDYITYWRDRVKDDIKFDFPDFKSLVGAIPLESNEITARLDNHTSKIIAALNKIGAADEANKIRLAPQLQPGELNRALSNWAGLDPARARRAILAMEPRDFLTNLTVPSAKTSDLYAALYWQRFPIAALTTLAREGAKEISDGLAELANYEHFPLAPPQKDDAKSDLSLQDVLKARAAFEKVRGATGGIAPATPGAGANRTIGQGSSTNETAYEDQLNLLRGTNALKDKKEYLDSLEKLFAALPPSDAPFSVNVTVLKTEPPLTQGVGNINRYNHMVISQGGKPLGQVIDLNVPPDQSCRVNLPGTGEITLQFRDVPQGAFVRTDHIGGPWALLRLYYNASIVRRLDNTKVVVETLLPDGPTTRYAFMLQIDFPTLMPTAKDWPVPTPK